MTDSICWHCGERKATVRKCSYPVCSACAADLDPEEMEEVVIESIKRGRIVPLAEIQRRKPKGGPDAEMSRR